MAGGKKGENSKKTAGNARKAEIAAQKQAAEGARNERMETEKWQQGAKNSSKKEAAELKAADAARKKADKKALLAEEEASMPSKPKNAGAKTAIKKILGPDLSQLDISASKSTTKSSVLNASGIDDAIDALSLVNTSGENDKIDRHPERRFKAALAVYEERRLEEMKDDKGLRRQQKVDLVRKEFEKSPENPFNQTRIGRYNLKKDEANELRQFERERTERRLGDD